MTSTQSFNRPSPGQHTSGQANEAAPADEWPYNLAIKADAQGRVRACEVERVTDLSADSINRRMAAGAFPPKLPLTRRMWMKADIITWLIHYGAPPWTAWEPKLGSASPKQACSECRLGSEMIGGNRQEPQRRLHRPREDS